MIKHILKIIWAQRKSNGWIFAELVVVMGALWFMMDALWVDVRTYNSPVGFDISNTWRFKLGTLPAKAPGYVPDSLYTSNVTQDLLRLVSQIRQEPRVEEACITYWSAPYGNGSSWGPLYPVDGDTATFVGKNFHKRLVSPEYFDVFRIKDTEGKAISPAVKGAYKPIVITTMGEAEFYGGQSGKGRKISLNEDYSEPLTVMAVAVPQRNYDYERAENCAYTMLEGESLEGCVKAFGASMTELCVRMKTEMSEDDMYAFLESMGDRLTANNIYVYGVRAIPDMRAAQLVFKENENSKKFSVMAFLLVNVFFGIVGTFWLRTQYRRGEIGLRVALGSSKSQLGGYMYLEGLSLLAMTLPFILLFAANLVYLDKLDSFRMPLTAGRFLATFGVSYLLMGGMICLGIWLPVRRAVRMEPAEALRYE